MSESKEFEPEIISRKPWIAYVKFLLPPLVLAFIGLVIYDITPKGALFFVVCAALFAAYQILELRSAKLIVDADGVYYQSGAFPWNKGHLGVKWGELDSAFFGKGFIPWIARSYNIIATHKFSRTEVFVATDMSNGAEAVSLINDLRNEYLTHQGVA